MTDDEYIEKQKAELTGLTQDVAKALYEATDNSKFDLGYVVILTRAAHGGGILSATTSNLKPDAFQAVLDDITGFAEDEAEESDEESTVH